MSKLFSRSKMCLKSANYALSQLTNEDAALDNACFQLQQSLEFAIKYIFEVSTGNHPWGHSIEELICTLENTIDIPAELAVFKGKAKTYTAWERDSRYLDSFVATVSDAKECAERLEDLHMYIEHEYVANTEVPKEVLQWCKDNAPGALSDAPIEEMLTYMLPIYAQYNK